jgi:hypothetical protein
MAQEIGVAFNIAVQEVFARFGLIAAEPKTN